MKSEGKCFTLIPTLKDKGIRLDIFLTTMIDDYSRSFISELIHNGNIRVDKIIKKAGYRLKGEEVIDITIPAVKPASFEPEAIDLDILHEDGNIIVINKPAGMVVHPAPGNFSGTVVNALLHHCSDIKGIGGELRPGIIHRLDKDTSGVLVVAKTHHAHQYLSEQFKERTTQKFYSALVYGVIKQKKGVIDIPIGRHPIHRKKMSTHSRHPRQALTLWQLKKSYHGIHLFDIQIKTGRTHQIRVHLSSIGHPIVGDMVYGNQRALPRLLKSQPNTYHIIKKVSRQMLHARCIQINHPITKKEMIFEAALPHDFSSQLKELNKSI